MRQVVAFLGRAGAGKDYQCSLLQQKGFKRIAFADILREMACQTLGLDYNYAMKHYDELKKTELYNGQNFRNILENLGSSIRKYDPNFFASAVVNQIVNDERTNYCISDLRYPNEAKLLYDSLPSSKVTFVFCDYKSDRYQEVNNHESALLANRLCEKGYTDLQQLSITDIIGA